MGFIRSTFLGFVLLCVVGFVISQETTSKPSMTIETTTTVATTTETPETTTKPTDPPTTTTTTTTPPSTTPVPASTTPKPPLPEKGSWNVTDGNVTCIRAELQIGFNVFLGGVEESFALSPNASNTGSDCQAPNGTQVLALSYKNYALTFIFAKDSSSSFVQHIALSYITPQGPEIFYNSSQLFKVKVGNSFQCKTTDTVLMGNATMQVYYIHVQAFGTAEENGFNTAEECEADDKVSDIIPIAVACALAALIIIVLIAYLVGRRRSRQKGYTSV